MPAPSAIPNSGQMPRVATWASSLARPLEPRSFGEPRPEFDRGLRHRRQCCSSSRISPGSVVEMVCQLSQVMWRMTEVMTRPMTGR
jgi:hypothetical protein